MGTAYLRAMQLYNVDARPSLSIRRAETVASHNRPILSSKAKQKLRRKSHFDQCCGLMATRSSAEPRRAPDRAYRGAVYWKRNSPEDTTHMRLAVLIATLALALQADAKTVYLFRHCVRSINESGLSDFTGQTFPP